ncbi:hypothetical protein ACMAUO_12385 [Gluconacetobacter sp. Hr-1-5]|uniref:hypothetical protein n=1 Tax=Gluconacetobacter sp. Hr-1-5 TaxID=3395370 RepID=UPI003B529A13
MEHASSLATGSAGDLREVDYWLFGAVRPRSCPLRVLVAGGDAGGAARLAEALHAEGRPGEVDFLASGGALVSSVYDYIDCDLSAEAEPTARLDALGGLLAPGGGVRVVVAAPDGRGGGYPVEGLFDLLAAAGLAPVCLMAPLAYDPALLEADPAMCTDLDFLPDRARAALAESRGEGRAFHVAYARRAGEVVGRADPMDPACVPVLRALDGLSLSRLMRSDNRLPVRLGGREVLLPVISQARGLLPLIDGRRTVGELAAILDNRGVDAAQFRQVWRVTFATFAGLNQLLLQAPP